MFENDRKSLAMCMLVISVSNVHHSGQIGLYFDMLLYPLDRSVYPYLFDNVSLYV